MSFSQVLKTKAIKWSENQKYTYLQTERFQIRCIKPYHLDIYDLQVLHLMTKYMHVTI